MSARGNGGGPGQATKIKRRTDGQGSGNKAQKVRRDREKARSADSVNSRGRSGAKRGKATDLLAEADEPRSGGRCRRAARAVGGCRRYAASVDGGFFPWPRCARPRLFMLPARTGLWRRAFLFVGCGLHEFGRPEIGSLSTDLETVFVRCWMDYNVVEI